MIDHLTAADVSGLDIPSPGYYLGELTRLERAHTVRGGLVEYARAFDEAGGVIGLLPLYLAGPPPDSSEHPATGFEAMTGVAAKEVCLAGSPGSAANYLAVAASFDEDTAAGVTGELVHAARSAARTAGSEHVVFPDLSSAQAARLDRHGPAPIAVRTRQKAVLPVGWSSFEEYVARLPGQRRGAVRRERRRFLEGPLTVREHRLVDVADELAPLLGQTERRYGRQVMDEQMEFYLLAIASFHPANSFVLTASRDDGPPLAFSLVLRRGRTWDMRAWGCDYAALEDRQLYFNLAFYEPIVRAAAEGVEALDYGTGSLNAKTLRGCEPRELHTVLMSAL